MAFAVWITGLPASGKSTLARAVADALARQGIRVQILESDALRKVLTPQPAYSEQERDQFYAALASIGALLVQNGVPVIFDATAPKRLHREAARREIPRFLEVYVRCPLEVCIARDPKGIYRKGQAGETATVPGLQVPYEEPEEPEVAVDGSALDAEAAAEEIVEALRRRGWVDSMLRR